MAVLVTGGTGFVGGFLISGLLGRGEHVYALVRPVEGKAPYDRLATVLGAVGMPPHVLDALPERLTVFPGDVTQPGMGLDEAARQTLRAEVDAIWHSAGLTNLQSDPAVLGAVNVDGTRHMLEFAKSVPQSHVYHISTAYVAGASQALVREDRLDDPHGFDNPYEASKHAAEHVVHDWARDTNRSVTIFRPSVLITDRAPLPGAPLNTLQQVANIARLFFDDGDRTLIRIQGDPNGRLNFLPVESAVEMMLLAKKFTEGLPAGKVDTFHVVHTQEAPIYDLKRAVEETIPVSIEFVREPLADPSVTESLFLAAMHSFLPYAYNVRHFHAGRLASLGVPCPIVDHQYLARSMRLADVSQV
jgi:nucleoside-diphosphate-sugar epimerase